MPSGIGLLFVRRECRCLENKVSGKANSPFFRRRESIGFRRQKKGKGVFCMNFFADSSEGLVSTKYSGNPESCPEETSRAGTVFALAGLNVFSP